MPNTKEVTYPFCEETNRIDEEKEMVQYTCTKCKNPVMAIKINKDMIGVADE